MSYDIKRSVSLYSYQDEYYNGQLDLEGCLRETAKTGATGVELLAEQMIKRFPLPIETQEFRDHWFEMLKNIIWSPPAMMHFWRTKFTTTVLFALESRSI